ASASSTARWASSPCILEPSVLARRRVADSRRAWHERGAERRIWPPEPGGREASDSDGPAVASVRAPGSDALGMRDHRREAQATFDGSTDADPGRQPAADRPDEAVR